MTQPPLSRRSRPRVRCFKEGKIIFGNGTFVLDCTIDNLSEVGAHLRVPGSAPLPTDFLLVELSRNLLHKAQIVRRTPRGVGVKLNGLLEDPQTAEVYLRRFRR